MATDAKVSDSISGGGGEDTMSKCVVDIQQCTVSEVTVYVDAAEVCRRVSGDQLRPAAAATWNGGKHELLLTNLPETIDKASIRVEGHGDAIVREVTYMLVSGEDKPDSGEDGQDSEVKNLQKQIDDKQVKVTYLQDDHERVAKQRQVLNNVADNLHGNIGKETTNTTAITDFLHTYNKEVQALNGQIQKLNSDMAKINDEIASLKTTLELRKNRKVKKLSRQCSIILDVKNGKDIDLLFYYLVKNAKWSPSYDIRVHTNTSDSDSGSHGDSKASMQLTYFGVVQQHTGEEWNDVQLKLATATPSVGGTIPVLGTYSVSLADKCRQPLLFQRSRARNLSAGRAKRRSLQKCGLAPMGFAYSMAKEEDEDSESPEIEYAPASVNSSASVNTIFNIPRRSSIASDDQGHKVCVGIISLSPTYSYEIVARMDASAYLKATVKNTSEYALLPGTANIFMNNNFVATSQLKSVSPGEEFTCSLGKDPSIRVIYHPIQTFTKDAGFIGKDVSTMYKQMIEVKNTMKRTADIMVREPLPKSNDNKIKIKLIQPADVGAKHSVVTLNTKFNHLEWKHAIAGGVKKEMVIEYCITHPSDESIDTKIV